MDPCAFTNTDDGILNAEHALDSLRAILNIDKDRDDSDTSIDDESEIFLATRNSVNPDGLNEDKYIALLEQLGGLEDMLRLVTDARLAKSLSGPGIEVDGESIDVLRRVIQIATDIVGSEMAYPMSDDEEGPSRDEANLRRAQSDAVYYSLEGPLSPLTDLESDSDSEEPNPICIVCGMDLSPTDRVKMPCGHIYCPGCTKELVRTYTTRPFPNSLLRCCPHPKPSISLEHVDRFINVTLRRNLDKKLKEAETPHDQRIYCPQEQCRRFINPGRVTMTARRVGYTQCPNRTCKVRICLDCKELIHIGVDCDTNADNSQARRIQKQFGWSRCPGCRYVVEKIAGCDHIVCTRCGRDFNYYSGLCR